jgi:Ca2+-binding RTX toxin-like protein
MLGLGGNDYLDGGLGADVMKGGLGNDTYVVDNAGDSVIEANGEGYDTVRTTLGTRTATHDQLYVLPAFVEALIATSATGQAIRGNTLNNHLVGGDGDDFIAAHDLGTDTVEGGAGDDFIYMGGEFTAADTISGGAGTDTLALLGAGTTFDLKNVSGIERLALYSSSFTGSQPVAYYFDLSDDSVLAAGDRLFVTATSLQADEILNFNGSKELDGRFTIHGGAGKDVLTGGGKGDHLYGNGGRDTIDGGAGNDTLSGGAGRDVLIGGAGRDTFLYGGAAESSGLEFDIILGFDPKEDKIDLHSTVSGWTGLITEGTLSEATFNADLAAAVDGVLESYSAVLFVANEGTMSHTLFMVIDADGDGVYTEGADYVFALAAPASLPNTTTEYFI